VAVSGCCRPLLSTETSVDSHTVQAVASALAVRNKADANSVIAQENRSTAQRPGWTSSTSHTNSGATEDASTRFRTSTRLLLAVSNMRGRWSQGGEYLVSGSDDHRLYLWASEDKYSVRKVLETGRTDNSDSRGTDFAQDTLETSSPQSSCPTRTTQKSSRVLATGSSSSPKSNTHPASRLLVPPSGHGTATQTWQSESSPKTILTHS